MRPATAIDYDVSLRVSSSHFQRPKSRTSLCRSGKQPPPVIVPPCCEARVERIKLHSGYYPATTPVYIPEIARINNARCLILLGEEMPPSSSRCSSRSSSSLPIFKIDSDLEEDNLVVVEGKRSVGLSTKDDLITIESFKVARTAANSFMPVQQIDDVSNVVNTEQRNDDSQQIVEVSLAAITTTIGWRMPRPVVDHEALWRKVSDKEKSEGRFKKFIEFPEEDIIMDKVNVISHMGRSVYSMSAKLKAELSSAEDFKFLSRFVQMLHMERKTMDMELEDNRTLPLGDHMEAKTRQSPAPAKQQSSQRRPSTGRRRRPQSPSKQQEQQKKPQRPKSVGSPIRHLTTPVETFARTSSPILTWHSQHYLKTSSSSSSNNKDEAGNFKTTMCG